MNGQLPSIAEVIHFTMGDQCSGSNERAEAGGARNEDTVRLSGAECAALRSGGRYGMNVGKAGIVKARYGARRLNTLARSRHFYGYPKLTPAKSAQLRASISIDYAWQRASCF